MDSNQEKETSSLLWSLSCFEPDKSQAGTIRKAVMRFTPPVSSGERAWLSVKCRGEVWAQRNQVWGGSQSWECYSSWVPCGRRLCSSFPRALELIASQWPKWIHRYLRPTVFSLHANTKDTRLAWAELDLKSQWKKFFSMKLLVLSLFTESNPKEDQKKAAINGVEPMRIAVVVKHI